MSDNHNSLCCVARHRRRGTFRQWPCDVDWQGPAPEAHRHRTNPPRRRHQLHSPPGDALNSGCVVHCMTSLNPPVSSLLRKPESGRCDGVRAYAPAVHASNAISIECTITAAHCCRDHPDLEREQTVHGPILRTEIRTSSTITNSHHDGYGQIGPAARVPWTARGLRSQNPCATQARVRARERLLWYCRCGSKRALACRSCDLNSFKTPASSSTSDSIPCWMHCSLAKSGLPAM